MKAFLFFLLFPYSCIAQYQQNDKLQFKATVITDTATIHGYFAYNGDSSIILSSKKIFSASSMISIPASSIREMHLKKMKTHWGGVAACTVLGFIVTAGLTKNSGDFDDDGKTSFFELLLTAIEGSTSSNRKRRNTALIVGAVGGTAGLLVGIFAGRKFTLVFPVSNRSGFYREKKLEVNDFVQF